MSINRVIVTGHLTRDPELRQTAGGTPILHFGIAVNDRAKNAQSGEWEDRPNFVDCVLFGSRTEALSRILAKGMKVALDGRLRYSAWEKDGQKHSKLEIAVDSVDLMAKPREQAMNPQQAAEYMSQQYGQPVAAVPMQATAPVQAQQPALYDEDIPF